MADEKDKTDTPVTLEALTFDLRTSSSSFLASVTFHGGADILRSHENPLKPSLT